MVQLKTGGNKKMLTGILFIIIGIWLEAPVWYYFLCGGSLFFKLLKYGLVMYNIGKKK